MNARLEQENDPEVLRAALRLLDKEYRKVVAKLREMTRKASSNDAKGQAVLALELQALEQKLADANRRLFAPTSEKRPRDEAAADAADVAPAEKKKGHGPRPQLELPRKEVVHEVAAADRSCTSCGKALEPWADQDETSEEITVVERRFVVLTHRRQKMRCACGACIQVAAPPLKLREGGRYSVDFAVEVAAAKYLDHQPLERQVRTMAREGLKVDSQTLWDQLDAASAWLQPAWMRLGSHQRAQPLLHVDETPWLLADKKKAASRWWAWISRSQDGVFFELKDSRSAEAAKSLLEGYCGLVMSDGYAAYGSLRKTALRERGASFRHAHCWAHVRRKFVALEETFPVEAKEALDRIGALFELEQLVSEERIDDTSLTLRAQIRRERSAPLVKSLGEWLATLCPLPQSGLGKAVQYTEKLWAGLTLFLVEPLVPLSNNAAERAIRGAVVGRKNYYGSRSERGCQVAAILYSLVESAKLCDIEPKAYLRGALDEALRGVPVRLPHEVRADLAAR